MNDFPRLCRSELHRLLARRITRILALVYVAVIVALCVIAFSTHSKDPNAGRTAAAREQAKQVEACLNPDRSPKTSDGAGGEVVGPDRPSAAECQSIEVPAEDKRWGAADTADAVKGMLGVAALLGFVLGASAGGAEWAAKTVQALLFWEPRRVRVMTAKAIALSAVVIALAVLGQLLVVAGTWIVTLTRGTTEGFTRNVWQQILASQGRGFALVAIAAVAAFSLSSLTRNTGAALGAAFVYLVILEQLIFAWKPWMAHYLLTPNVAALVAGHADIDQGGTRTVLHSGGAGLMLSVYVAALFALATALFARRDVT